MPERKPIRFLRTMRERNDAAKGWNSFEIILAVSYNFDQLLKFSVPYDFTLDQIDDLFGDVGGVIRNAFKMARD